MLAHERGVTTHCCECAGHWALLGWETTSKKPADCAQAEEESSKRPSRRADPSSSQGLRRPAQPYLRLQTGALWRWPQRRAPGRKRHRISTGPAPRPVLPARAIPAGFACPQSQLEPAAEASGCRQAPKRARQRCGRRGHPRTRPGERTGPSSHTQHGGWRPRGGSAIQAERANQIPKLSAGAGSAFQFACLTPRSAAGS